METKLIEPKPVTYHVTKYVYPNVDNNGDLNGLNGGYLNNGGLNNNSFHQAGYTNQYHNSGGDLAAIFPDARKMSYNPIFGTSQYHNGYGLNNTNAQHIVRPRSSGANGTSAGVYGNKPYSSSGPYASFEQPRFSSSLPRDFNSSGPIDYGFGQTGNLFPSLVNQQTQSADIFKKPAAYYQNGVLNVNR